MRNSFFFRGNQFLIGETDTLCLQCPLPWCIVSSVSMFQISDESPKILFEVLNSRKGKYVNE